MLDWALDVGVVKRIDANALLTSVRLYDLHRKLPLEFPIPKQKKTRSELPSFISKTASRQFDGSYKKSIRRKKKKKRNRKPMSSPIFRGDVVLRKNHVWLFCCVCCALPCRLVNLEKLKSKKNQEHQRTFLDREEISFRPSEDSTLGIPD